MTFSRRFSSPRGKSEPVKLDGPIELCAPYGRLPGIDSSRQEWEARFKHTEVLDFHTEVELPDSFIQLLSNLKVVRSLTGTHLPRPSALHVPPGTFVPFIEPINSTSIAALAPPCDKLVLNIMFDRSHEELSREVVVFGGCLDVVIVFQDVTIAKDAPMRPGSGFGLLSHMCWVNCLPGCKITLVGMLDIPSVLFGLRQRHNPVPFASKTEYRRAILEVISNTKFSIPVKLGGGTHVTRDDQYEFLSHDEYRARLGPNRYDLETTRPDDATKRFVRQEKMDRRVAQASIDAELKGTRELDPES